ncbi:uncharacterized protein B0H64DRAFT_366067 [Chaetomium fimeti]|uniref:Uncharacterized protein n=1 Tax=Chaetomium fimeti TaxID=1854472 RepID=A0AAE0H860_9PEZI|nr:hypothetical protein B0H64DRAFT_366067 [Chaetomium fimeti]
MASRDNGGSSGRDSRDTRNGPRGSNSRDTEAPRATRVSRSNPAPSTSSTLPLRPIVRTVDRGPDDGPRPSRPQERPAPRPQGNAQIITVEPRDDRYNDDRHTRTRPQEGGPADDVPPRPTEKPMTIRINGKRVKNPEPATLGAVHRIVRLALDMLDDKRSFDALIYLGASSVHGWGLRKDPKEIIYPTRSCNDENYRHKKPSDSEMKGWLRAYTQKIRRCFLPLDIGGLDEGTDALFGMADWVQNARERCFDAGEEPNNVNIMHHWHPLDAGAIRINVDSITVLSQIRSWYLEAKNSGNKENAARFGRDYHTLLVNDALTVAHELVHVFIAFLAGDRTVGTPRNLVPKAHADKGIGESGRMWEDLVVGGCVHLALPEQNGNPVRITLEKDDKEIEVDPEDIKNMAKGKFRFPVKTVGKWVLVD